MLRGFAILLIKFLLFISAVRCSVADLAIIDMKYEIEKINAKLEDLQERLVDFQNEYLANVVSSNQAATRNQTINIPASCSEAFDAQRGSGIYHIYLPASGLQPFAVYCLKDEQHTHPWTVFQRRVDDTTDFYRGWEDYQRGFGDMNGNFWIGLDKLHALTGDPNNPQELWIQVKANVTAYARYSRFVVGDEFEFYKLKQLGDFVGTAGDSLSYNIGMKFTTKDYDNDRREKGNCAHQRGGAWWYGDCSHSNLNGKFGGNSDTGLEWHYFRSHESMAYAHMALKPARKK